MEYETVTRILEITDGANKFIRPISASEAFRKFDWLNDVPISNASGNLRGMVIDANWRTVHIVSSKFQKGMDALEAIGILQDVATESLNSYHSMVNIFSSRNDGLTKAAKISTQVSGICIRVVTKWGLKTVSSPFHIVNWISGRSYDAGLQEIDSAALKLTTYVYNETTGDGLYNLVSAGVK